MRRHARARSWRWAAAASAALHALAAGALLLLVRAGEHRPGPPGIDTHAADAPQVRISLVDDSSVSLAAPTPAKPLAAVTAAPPRAAPSMPSTLPPEAIAKIRRPMPLLPARVNPPAVADPNVEPAGGTDAPAPRASTPAIHGALKPDQTAVYVLDCSGSMGESGKFDAARAALVATLAQQPSTVRFQVIVYAGSAVPLVASDRRGLPATEANVRAAAGKLAALEPRGRSNHLEAVRAALAFRPDVILILTDADDLAPAALRRVFAGEPKPVPVCVARVTAAGVERPREVK